MLPKKSEMVVMFDHGLILERVNINQEMKHDRSCSRSHCYNNKLKSNRYVVIHDKFYLISHHSAESCDDICQHFFVGVAEVRRAVSIVDCGGDVELFAHRKRRNLGNLPKRRKRGIQVSPRC